MLIQIQPGQVPKYWELIKVALQKSLPPTIVNTPEKINNIFEALLVGQLICWASANVDYENEETKLEGILITTVFAEKITRTKSLVIFCLYTFVEKSADLSWEEGIEKLKRYADAKGCSNIISLAKNKYIGEIVKQYGGDDSNRLIILPV